MPPTLRKRAAPPPPAPPAKKATKAPKEPKAAKAPKAAKESKPPASNPAKDESGGLPAGAGGLSSTADNADAPKEASSTTAAPTVKETSSADSKAKTGGAPKVGDQITLAGFGGEIETHEGKKTSFEELVKDSPAGVVLFTYPKASTPGCTTQACLFRDAYEPLTATGLRIYGLSTDSPKANTTFKTKQNLSYPLLCDPSATLIGAIGLKKAPKGTTRGVFVVDKQGKVLVAEPGSPAGTVEVVKKLVASLGGDSKAAADAAKSAL